ncbi:MAG: hypothetical protein OEV73_12245 [Desulfobulbaceae bacterium]|nr:hypothetical protein [Desulfobulbaceae bacterium]
MALSKQIKSELHDGTGDAYDEAARLVVDLANRIADEQQEADLWDISDGLLMGAIHYWLYTRQPCDDPMCEECEPVSNPEQRLQELHRMVDDFAKDSDYFQSAHDIKVGRA